MSLSEYFQQNTVDNLDNAFQHWQGILLAITQLTNSAQPLKEKREQSAAIIQRLKDCHYTIPHNQVKITNNI